MRVIRYTKVKHNFRSNNNASITIINIKKVTDAQNGC